MLLRPRYSPARATLATGTTALAALLLGTMAAVAAPAGSSGQQEGDHGSAEHGSPAASPGCADRLVTFARDGTVGDDRAVALTAQALERNVDGWQLLAWQVQAGTMLTRVVATGIDGERREVSPAEAGTVEHVLSLTFCGSHGAAVVAAGGDGTVPAGATTQVEPAAAATEPAAPAAGPAAALPPDDDPRTGR